MATKQLNSRIQWKRDTSANWESNNPVLLDGEIIIVTTNAGETRFKVGDGVKTYTQLPFQDEAVRALITELSETVDTKLTTPNGTKGQFLGYTANNVVGAVDAPVSLFNAQYSGKLTRTGWTTIGSTGAYRHQQIINVPGMQDSLFFVYLDSSDSLQKENWQLIEEVAYTSNNTIVFYTYEVPLVALNFTVVYNASPGSLAVTYPNFTEEAF